MRLLQMTTFTLDFTAANLTGVTKVEVGFTTPMTSVHGYRVNNGAYTEVKDGSTSAVIYSGAAITLEGITVKSPDKDTVDQAIHWIKINDNLLVDAPAIWDTNQVWSVNTTGPEYAAFPVSNGFDGNTSTFTYGADTNGARLTVNFTGVTGTKFEVFAYSGVEQSGGVAPSLEVNDIAIGTYNNVWVDVSTFAAGQLNSITIKSAATGIAAAPGFAAVRVDGRILVDQGSIGENGFTSRLILLRLVKHK